MNRKNRVYGLLVCLILILYGAFLFIMTPFVTLGYFLVGIAAGFGLRDTLEPIQEVKEE